MKRIFTYLLIFLLNLSASVLSFSQGAENFTNLPTASSTSYVNRSWTGTNSVIWTAMGARTDQTLNTKAICFGTSSAGTREVLSPSYTGGMALLTFNYVKGFTNTDARSFEVFVNGVSQGTTTVSTSSTTPVGYSKSIDVTGNVVLRIVSLGTSSSGGQIIIDDIAWTGFAPVLPVELKNIKVSKKNAAAELSWQTATENNNSHFNIERSDDGVKFGKLDAVKGHGTTNIVQDYTFTDDAPLKNINYYRLRQVDFDGKETVSKTVSINFDGKGQGKAKVYPTLVKDVVNIELAQDTKAEISVRDLTGRVVLTQNTEGATNTSLNLSNLNSGMYLLSIRTNEGVETVKIQKY